MAFSQSASRIYKCNIINYSAIETYFGAHFFSSGALNVVLYKFDFFKRYDTINIWRLFV